MGMYTEFIFSARLSKDTPKECIDSLDYIINGEDKQPKYENPKNYEERTYNSRFIERTTDIKVIEEFIETYDFWRLFMCSSYYFSGADPVHIFYWDDCAKSYMISTRANCKNYECQIQKFIDYIKPYVESGSGYAHNIFALVQYEESEFPTLYGIDGTFEMMDPKIQKEYEAKNLDWYERLTHIYQSLIPEFTISQNEIDKRKLPKDYKPSYKEIWDWSTDYLIDKYLNQHPPVSNAKLDMLLEKAVDKVFCENLKNISDEEIQRYKEIIKEFNILLNA